MFTSIIFSLSISNFSTSAVHVKAVKSKNRFHFNTMLLFYNPQNHHIKNTFIHFTDLLVPKFLLLYISIVNVTLILHVHTGTVLVLLMAGN